MSPEQSSFSFSLKLKEQQPVKLLKFSLSDDVATLKSALIELVKDNVTVDSAVLPVRTNGTTVTVTGRAVFPVLTGVVAIRVSLRDNNGQTRFAGSASIAAMQPGNQTVSVTVSPVFSLTGTAVGGQTLLSFSHTLSAEIAALADAAVSPSFTLSLASGATTIFTATPTRSGSTLSYSHSADLTGYVGQSLTTSLVLADGATVLASGSSAAFTLTSAASQALPPVRLVRQSAALSVSIDINNQGDLAVSIDVGALLATFSDWAVAGYALDVVGGSTNALDAPLSLSGNILSGSVSGVAVEPVTITLKLHRADQSLVASSSAPVDLATLSNSATFAFTLTLALAQDVSTKGVLGLTVYDSARNGPLEASVDISGPEITSGLSTDGSGFLLQNLIVGTYHLSVRKAGYADASLDVVIAAGEVSNVTVGLGASAPSLPACSSLNAVAYWSFDDADVSGASLLDRVGNNHANIIGPTTGQPGQVGQAFAFDGVDDGMNVGNFGKFNMGSGSFSIAAWVKTTGLSHHILGDDGVLFSHYGGNPEYNAYVSLDKARLDFRDAEEDRVDFFGQSNVNDGDWHFIVAMRDGATGKVYVDGVLEGTQTNNALGSTDSSCNFSRIGAGNSGPGNCTSTGFSGGFLDGLLDELAIFNRALSEAEIFDFYDAGAAGFAYCQ